jgi:tRNA1(Val) A37 N6-methylase TrmN6
VTIDTSEERTVDAFLGGLVEAVQPRSGHHRSGLEAVLLGSALPSDLAGMVVDLGAGAGVAGFCAAARCRRADVLLVERNAELLALAAEALDRPANRAFRGRVRLAHVDIARPETERIAAGLARGEAAAVITNPPFHDGRTVREPDSLGRREAHILPDGLETWIRTAASVLRPGGVLVIVTLAASLPGLIASLSGRFGRARLLPLHARPTLAAERLLVAAVKGSRAPLELLPGLVLHGGEGSGFTDSLEGVLRRGVGLADIHPAWRP